MEVNIGVKLHNRFDAVLTDAKTGKVKQVAKAENVVTNSYWSVGESASCIALGTGTGTPSVTDTALFNALGRYKVATGYGTRTVSRLGAHEWKCTFNFTLTENEANGNLTEIGIMRDTARYSEGWETDYLSTLYTHAMFTDAEGNPIIITKTNSDRLTVTAVLYLTLSWENSNNVYVIVNERNPQIKCDPRLDYVQGDSYKSDLINLLFAYGSLSAGIYYSINTLAVPKTYSPAATSGTYTINRTTQSIIVRYKATNRVLATAGNVTNPSTYLIRGISNSYGIVSLPQASVYPTRQITLSTTGDGSTTEFNFAIPILKTDNVKVYIDNVLQNSSNYTFNGRNFKHPQGWESYDTLYLDHYTLVPYSSSTGSQGDDSKMYGPVKIGSVSAVNNYYDGRNTNEYYYDFKTNYTVSAVGKYALNANNYNIPRLFYSNDNTNWTEISLWSSTTDYSNFPNIDATGGFKTITPVSARYWKVINPGIAYKATGLYATILFGDPKPQLNFNTAPPADSEVKIEAYCEYPIKNTDWIIEDSMTFDYTFTRL